MGKARQRDVDEGTDNPAHSGTRPVARPYSTTTVERLMHPRPLEDQWDDRYGLLPPEPPRSEPSPDSVMLALSDLQPASPRYGALSGVSAVTHSQAELKKQLNSGLSFVGGYVDAVGFVALMGLFPSHVTGELVSLSTQVAASGSAFGHQSLLVSLFLGGVVVSVALGRWLTKRRRSPFVLQLGLLSTSLIAFLCVGMSHGVVAEHSWMTITSGAAVFAMGVQNAIMRSALAGTLPTTVMTGNLTQLVTELFNWTCGRLDSAEDKEQLHLSLRRASILARVLGCFFSGALLGAWLTKELGLLSVALPAVLAASLTFHVLAVDRLAARAAS